MFEGGAKEPDDAGLRLRLNLSRNPILNPYPYSFAQCTISVFQRNEL